MYPTGASTQNAAANGRGKSGLPPSRPRFARLTLQDEAPPLNEAELPPDPLQFFWFSSHWRQFSLH